MPSAEGNIILLNENCMTEARQHKQMLINVMRDLLGNILLGQPDYPDYTASRAIRYKFTHIEFGSFHILLAYLMTGFPDGKRKEFLSCDTMIKNWNGSKASFDAALLGYMINKMTNLIQETV